MQIQLNFRLITQTSQMKSNIKETEHIELARYNKAYFGGEFFLYF